MRKPCFLVAMLVLFIFGAKANPSDSSFLRKKYFTQRLQGTINLDGIPNEDAWNIVEWGGDFIQWMPNEGKPPSQPSNFKIIYDDKFLYIAYQCHDVSADSVIRRMSRRDQFPGDWIEINIDSYHDLRTAFSFTISASGVRGDEFVSNDGTNWDTNWNPIWYSKTNVTDKGWTAEIKIPLSQLRYGNEANKVWGFQVTRRLFRKEERSFWQHIPQNSGVWVSRFGELHGLKDIPMHKQIEIAPYVTVQADTYKKEPGNPFAKGFDKKLSAGVDGKLAITNDLILDFTVNPDFGQVEADPSQVRIDGYQNFFPEQRPFFIESRNIFNYQLTGSQLGGDYDADLLFYSRRIGGTPHAYPNIGPNEFVRVPQNTSILGAAKFSGKTKNGLSIGILESVTQREMATIEYNGQKREEVVEPLTNFAVARLQKDSKDGNTIIGGILTGVNREKGLSDILHRNAYSGGLDFVRFWKNRTWYVRGNVIFSHVNGTKEAILKTQTAFEHLFQRPDAKEVSVDDTRTSLTGTGGTVRFGKAGGKTGKHGQVFKFETGLTYRSPQLEVNDIGFMLTANEINQFTWAGLQFQRPFSVFRAARLNINHWAKWDGSGRFLFDFLNFNAHGTFKSNWQTGMGFSYNPFEISNNALRGASSMRRPIGVGPNAYLTSDQRKKVYGNVNLGGFWGFENTVRSRNVNLQITFQPLNALNVSLSGNYSYYWRRQDQFVENITYDNSTRSIVSSVTQKTLRFVARINYNITPDLTLQYYGQPYITRPLYSNFGYVSDPMAKQFDDRFHIFTSNEISFDANSESYLIDETHDGITDYSFGKPDFNFVQFRSNFVVRWEYRRGSELYLVWSQGNTPDASDDLDSPLPTSLFENAFAGPGRNIFLIKWTYRFLR
ncbi:MAG: DUF5916 domain-containing protein [Chitinophagales bacterium]